MKKLIAVILAAVMLSATFLFTSCADPLQKNIDGMQDAFSKLGDSLYRAYEAAYFAGAIDEDADVKAQFATWKKQIKAANNVQAAYLEYSAEELDAYAAEWNQLAADMDAMYDRYKDELLAAKEQVRDMLNK